MLFHSISSASENEQKFFITYQTFLKLKNWNILPKVLKEKQRNIRQWFNDEWKSKI